MARRILVTGGNSGIGYALCRQLAVEEKCHVYLGARGVEKGQAAVQAILESDSTAKCEFLQIDVSKDESVASAAQGLTSSLGSERLYAIVNNAGLIDDDARVMINTNLLGAKRVCEMFIPLLQASDARIVNVGSGAGPSYVKAVASEQVKKQLCSEDQTWEAIEGHLQSVDLDAFGKKGYGLSKALLTNYSSLLAKQNPSILTSCCSPGWIATNFGGGGSKAPKGAEEGTPAIKHLLFGQLEGNGWYYGSDGVRSPLHFMRNPGDPAYDGAIPSKF